MDQRVAVIIPEYNGASFLPETLDSILSQTLPPAEIIVVDDGSTDSLDACIKAYEPKGVRFLRTPNRGVCSARNTGVEVSKSPWVAFCDGDDIWLPQKLERQMDLLERAPDCQYCTCDFRNFSTDGLAERSHFGYAPPGFWDEGRRDFGSAGFVIERNMFLDFLTFQPSLPATPVMSREFFKRVGRWNDETSRYSAQDFEFHLLCANHPPLAVVPEVLVLYRRHAGNWSGDELMQDFGGVEILEYMLSRYEMARQHEGRLRKEIQQRTIRCADRAFFDGRPSLFRAYLGKVPLRRRPARLIARDLLSRALPEPAFRTIRRSVRTMRSKLSI